MQIAILAVLILIALLIAPWLIALIVAAAALYGVYVVGISVVAAALFAGCAAWVFLRPSSRQTEAIPITGGRKVCKACQAEMPTSDRKCPNCGTPT